MRSREPEPLVVAKWIAVAVCASMVAGMLVVGLAPFRPQRNDVSWLTSGNGIQIGPLGTLGGSRVFERSGSLAPRACSLEMWLEARFVRTAPTFLSFSTAENPLQFSLRQYESNVILERHTTGGPDQPTRVGVPGIFNRVRQVFLTFTSGSRRSAIYADGRSVGVFSRFHFADDCWGQLILGASPVAAEKWSGQLRGLAIYNEELTPADVIRHFAAWTESGRPEAPERKNALAVYVFDEHSGNIIHNKIRGGVDLVIPERYGLFRQLRFQPFWQEYRPGWDHWKDILVNIVGFMPLGFVFYACCMSIWVIKRPALATTSLGFAVSFSIEALQSFIPTRNSGTMDLITNTAGTCLGLCLYRLEFIQGFLSRIFPPSIRLIFNRR